MNWSDDKVYKLIEAFEKYEYLYAVSHKDYHNRTKKKIAYQELGQLLETTETEVSKKLHGLRTTFAEELRKMRCEKSGSGADDRRRRWKFFDSLIFLRDHVALQATQTFTNLPESSELKLADENDESESLAVSNELQPPPSTNASTSSSGSSDSSHRKRKAKEPSEADQTLQCLKGYIMTRMGQKVVPPEDEDDMFAKVVAADLKKIKDPRVKRGLKKKISDLLYQTLEEEEEKASASGHSIVLPTGEILSVVFEKEQ